MKINREELAYIDVNQLNNNKKNILKNINKNKNKYNLDRNIKLPEVIYDLSAVNVVPYQVNRPNFISNKKISSNFIFLKNKLETII